MTDLPHEAHLVALASLDGVGPGRLRWLLSHGSPAEAWDRVRRGRLSNPPPQLLLEPSQISAWRTASERIDPAASWRRCEEEGVGVVSIGSPGYPSFLAEDRNPPVVLFHRGDPDRLLGPRVAVVGTRRATGYGIRIAEQLGEDLARAGVVVVSGLALGIDAAAHRGALAADDRRVGVAAVVGGGLDQPCPTRNLRLAARVAAEGVLLSEVPPGIRALPWRFPVRNRVLAALADAVVVVESAGAGGSLHTVRQALRRDRPILAVPGPVDSRASDGTNQLLLDGAHPCLGVDDVLGAVDLARPGARAAPPAESRPAPSPVAARVLEEIGWRPVSAERLASGAGLGFAELAAALGELERGGWVRRSDGWIERIARPAGVRGGSHGAA
ncbi:MAG: DNA-processing protein DprA [Microthrixaceae bacterium]